LDILIEVLKGVVSAIMYFWWLIVLVFGFLAWQNFRKTKWVKKQESVVLQIKIPKTNDKNPTAAEMMFATLHGIFKPKTDLVRQGAMQENISFEIVADKTSISFYVWTPKHLKDFVEGQVYAQYPSAEIIEVPDYVNKVNLYDQSSEKRHISGAELVLEKADFLPIKTFNNFQVDPLAGITGVLAKLEGNHEEIWIQMVVRPVSDNWKRRGLDWVTAKKNGTLAFFSEDFGRSLIRMPFILLGELLRALIFGATDPKNVKLTAETESKISAIELKAEKLAFAVKIRVAYLSADHSRENERLQAIFGAFKQYSTTYLNGFKGKKHFGSDVSFLTDYRNRLFMGQGFHLNIEELASIYHLPHTSVETPNINWNTYKTGEPPTNLPTAENCEATDLTCFAETNFRSHRQKFGIKRDDRRRHFYIIGKSGMGKTKLLETMIEQDILKGEGVALMDPHGDYTTTIMKKIPKERLDDVIIFDPSDTNFPIGFNPMEVFDPNLKVQIAAGVVGTFKKIFGTSWGPRLEYILNYTVLALLDTPGSTLLGIVRMLTDKNFRKKIVDNIQDPVVKKFWTTEFASYNEKFATEAIAPILNKVGQFVANSLIRNVVGQPNSSFNIRKIMDERKILLINLSTGRLGETNAALLGSLMITAIQLGAMSRADIPEEERADFYLYVDEFQNFATESFKNILSEARKYRLNLVMANQYIAQMEDTGVKDAVFGNVGTIVTFRVGAADANELVKEFSPPFEAQDLVNIARQHVYIRMTIDGQSETAFSAKTLDFVDNNTGFFDEVVRRSRARYTRPKEEVEREVAEWSGISINVPVANVGGPSDTPSIQAEPVAVVDEDRQISSIEDIFEAPLVSRAKGKASKKEQSNAVKEAIKQFAPAKTPEPAKEAPKAAPVASETPKESKENSSANAQSATKATGESEAHVKVKDKIDKEILADILKTVVTPASERDKKENKINNHVEKKSEEKREEPSKGSPSATAQDAAKAAPSPAPEKKEEKQHTAMPSPKKEKVITPHNFKDVKEIHPHEVVKVESHEL
jgi:hypothetical protein